MTRPRILLADDHEMLLDAFEKLLESEYDIVGRAVDGQQLLQQARAMRPDIVVSDISMPGPSGLEVARVLLGELDEVRWVFLTMNEDPELAAEALRLGASGYVLKSAAAKELFAAVAAARAGGTYISPQITSGTLGHLARPGRAGTKTDKPDKHELTERQVEVLRFLAHGYSMKETAAQLGITPRTVAFHKYRMMEALDLETSAELIRHAISIGLVPE
jgi:DNA-binding NarL/FixJ family response regulator